jgi:proline iminopeptidase
MPRHDLEPAAAHPHTADDHLFPPIPAYAEGHLDVGSGHSIYWEESGASDGVPVVFLHGGPGAGTSPRHRRFFDPKAWRIVLHDQRGAGRSSPHGELTDNTTQALIADIEALREARGVERWLVFGGSWGSTLALAYAEAHPERCLGLVLRGVFLAERAETDWFMQGMAAVSPRAWEAFAAPIPPEERGDLIAAYQRRLNDPDPAVNGPAALAWSAYEAASCTLYPDPALLADMTSPDKALPLARLEAHYFANDCFLTPGQLIGGVERIRQLPGIIVQGRYDLLCPLAAAERLADAWPEAELVVVPDAGHSAFEPSIARELVFAVARMQTLITP